jgi:hypothetical protein
LRGAAPQPALTAGFIGLADRKTQRRALQAGGLIKRRSLATSDLSNPETAQPKGSGKARDQMPARLRKTHQEDVRTKIQTSQLINRLSDHGLGKLDLSPTQVRSIEVLLKKTLPDLQSIEHSGGIEGRLSPEMEKWLGRT